MKNLLLFVILAALISAEIPVSAATPAVAHDPFVGTWTLNAQKSKYPGRTCPKRMVIVIELAGAGIRYRSDTTYVNGSSARAEYTADYSGREAIVTGSTGLLLPVSLKRIDHNTVVGSYTRGLQVVATSKRVVSRDGRVMTVTTISPDKAGKKVASIGVYEKTKEVAAMK